MTVDMPSALLTDSCTFQVATTLTEKLSAPTPVLMSAVVVPEVGPILIRTAEQPAADRALVELSKAQQIANDADLAKKLPREFDAEDEAERQQQLAEAASNRPSTLAVSKTDLIPDDQLPVDKLRYDQIEELFYLQLMDRVECETEAIARKNEREYWNFMAIPSLSLHQLSSRARFIRTGVSA